MDATAAAVDADDADVAISGGGRLEAFLNCVDGWVDPGPVIVHHVRAYLRKLINIHRFLRL